jgi:hypothetical protein
MAKVLSASDALLVQGSTPGRWVAPTVVAKVAPVGTSADLEAQALAAWREQWLPALAGALGVSPVLPAPVTYNKKGAPLSAKVVNRLDVSA